MYTYKDCGLSPKVPNSVKNVVSHIGEGALKLESVIEYECAAGYFKNPYSDTNPATSYKCEVAGSWPSVTFECLKSKIEILNRLLKVFHEKEK